MTPLQPVPLDASNDPELVRGALDLDAGIGGGIVPRRLPAWTRPQLPDIIMDTVASLTAGVRIELMTDSPVIELELSATGIATTGLAFVPPAVELVVDGKVLGLQRAVEAAVIRVDTPPGEEMQITFEKGDRSTLRFEVGPAGTERHCQLWLPTGASVELHELRIDAASQWAPLPAPAAGRRRWVHYGSSISHCAEMAQPSSAWPIQVALRHGLDLLDLGLAGQCHLDPFLARTIRDVEADCISIKVGINLMNGATMTERTFGPAVHGFLDRVREGHPSTPLLLISPIFCPLVEDHAGPTVPLDNGKEFAVLKLPAEATIFSLTRRKICFALGAIVAARQAAGDDNLYFLDGLELFGPGDEHLLHDRLHPDEAGYRLLGERFERLVFGEGGALAGV